MQEQQENLLGVDEIVDTIVDCYEVGEAAYNQLEDGLQAIPDAFALLSQRGKVSEIILDFPTFKAQLLDIQGDEPTEIVKGIMSRLSVGAGKAREIVTASILVIASAYETYQAVQALVRAVK